MFFVDITLNYEYKTPLTHSSSTTHLNLHTAHFRWKDSNVP